VAEPGLPPGQRAPALVFAGFLLVIAVSAAALFLLKLGAGPEAVRAFYLGSEARFTGPRSLAGLLEVAVPHLLAIPLVLFAVSHVVAAAGALPPALARRLTGLSFGLALAGLGAGFGVRFLAPWLAWAKLAAFLGLELLLLCWAVLLASAAWPGRAAASGLRGDGGDRHGRRQAGSQRRGGLEPSLAVHQQGLGPGGQRQRQAGRPGLDHDRLRQDLGVDGGAGEDADRLDVRRGPAGPGVDDVVEAPPAGLEGVLRVR
jgi:hypothetical protein